MCSARISTDDHVAKADKRTGVFVFGDLQKVHKCKEHFCVPRVTLEIFTP